ncbi:hypothetical protein OIDMADRAFT_167064 [Oidiodendron maius Zn]|uniref:Ricin B lectin domain-containing protein n=1 Tax=Oidiodendron maius (strain Zn) TaxID=913774 RepID=A0A0C3CGY2_OIDMZ|nr:hypothetical protein OIDMADRAFT_167064 [Oidiodendron maius Zn]
MIVPLSALVLSAVAGSYAAPYPFLRPRNVTSLNQQAFEEAQQRDDTATRAFSSVPIKTTDGKCLFVSLLSGDFRANLNPIEVGECDGSTGQAWDIITAGKHNNVANSMLIVNTLTQACANFDPRRAVGNQAIMFSCGGRADGSGQVTNSQLFPFDGSAGPLSITPENQAGTCFTVKGNVIDVASCNSADANQSFTFDGTATSAPATSTFSTPGDVASVTLDTTITSATAPPSAATGAASTTPVATSATVATHVTTTDAPAASGVPDFNPTTPVPVSRAGGVLQPSAVAEAQQFDDTATRAFTGVSLKASNGQCLFIDPTAGDFRENLIPIAVQDCDGSPNEKFDFITQGKHNNAQNSTLVVSSLTNGCVNFDDRRAAGDTVIIFSCGGRADGDSQTTNSQLFPFSAAANGNSIVLAPENGNGQVCLVPINGKLDQTTCDGSADQSFTIVQ